MLSREERELRKSQLGASDIHKIFNFDNKGSQDLWELKMGLIEDSDFTNRHMTLGNLTEEDSLIYWFNKKGYDDYELHRRVEHREIKGLVVSTDGILNLKDNENYIHIPVENKTMVMHNFIKLDKPSRNYNLQIQTQMAVMGSPYGYIVFNGVDEDDLDDPLNYNPSALLQHTIKVERDDALIKEIEKRAKYFLWCMQFKHRPSENDYRMREIL